MLHQFNAEYSRKEKMLENKHSDRFKLGSFLMGLTRHTYIHAFLLLFALIILSSCACGSGIGSGSKIAPFTTVSKSSVDPLSTFVSVNNGVAYVSDKFNLVTYDVSNRAAPVVASTIAIPHSGSAWSVQGILIQGTQMYTAGYWCSYFQTFDISAPLAPTQVGTNGANNTNANYAHLAKAGNYLFATRYSGANIFRVFDMSSPATPAVAATLASFTGVTGAFLTSVLSGSYLYAGGKSGLVIVDVTAPTAPAQVGSIGSGAGVRGISQAGMVVQGNYAYMSSFDTSNNKFLVVDVTTKTSPTLASTVTLSSTAFDSGNAGTYGSVVLNNAYAYVGTDAIYKFNVSSPAAPVAEGSVVLDGNIQAMATDGRYLYVLTAAGSFYILDLGTGFY